MSFVKMVLTAGLADHSAKEICWKIYVYTANHVIDYSHVDSFFQKYT